MANSEAWTNLGEVGKLLYVQKYAIEEIQSLKPKSGMSAEEAQVYEDRLRKLFALFMFNQERINSDINPAHHQVQINLTERIRKLVTSYTRNLILQILHPEAKDTSLSIVLYPNSDSPSVFDFPRTVTPCTDDNDWIAYENYLVLSQDARDFNILCSSVPQDILPLIKRFFKEGATVYEVEHIVNKIRSDIDFDSLIDAEIQRVEDYPYPRIEKDPIEDFFGFVKMANQAMRILMVCDADAEESNGDRVMLMVERITNKFPKVVRDKWVKEVSRGGDASLFVKLRDFLRIPVKELMFDREGVVERWWFGGIFSRIFSKILMMFRWW